MPDDPNEILLASSRNRQQIIQNYLELGTMNSNPISSSIKTDESTALIDARKLLEQQIIIFSKSDLKELESNTSRLCLAMFLLDRLNTIRNMVLQINRSGLHSLYLSLQRQICKLLEKNYYSRPVDDILSDYIDIEPLLAACSELCGLPPASLDDVMQFYKSKLAEKIDDLS